MCCKSIWKGIAIFCLALMFGTFTSDSLTSREKSENKKPENLIPQKKNCVFADKELKYQNLPFDPDKDYTQQTKFEPKPLIVPVPQRLKEKSAEVPKKEGNVEKTISPHNPMPEKAKEKYHILLHKENCYE